MNPARVAYGSRRPIVSRPDRGQVYRNSTEQLPLRERSETDVVRVGHITAAAEPNLAPSVPTPVSSLAIPLSLAKLARELDHLARRDPTTFERAATLAKELQEELTLLTASSPKRHRRRRPTPRGSQRAPHSLADFEAERRALGSACLDLTERGIAVSEQQLSDLRLGARTRRIFRDAGLFYVQDVAQMAAAKAMEVPELMPSSVAELRAAIMFSLEAAGTQRAPAMLSPDHSDDLFEGLVHEVNQLPPREREVVVLRSGVEDRVHAPEDVARILGCDVEVVPQLEKRALNTLLSHPGALEACWRLEDLCAQLGLGWQDERLPTVVATRFPNTRASFTRVVSRLMRHKGQLAAEAGGRTFSEPAGIPHFEEMVVAALGRYGNLSEESLTDHVRAALSPVDRENYPVVEVSERMQMLGPAVQDDDGSYRLPDAPIPGLDDRHIRALNGLIGALQRLGTARISSLTTEVNRRLPRSYQINDQYVRTWLTRHPELFTQSDGHDRFKLASLEVDILCGLATSWLPGSSKASDSGVAKPIDLAGERLRDRAALEISEFLRVQGPQPIGRIRTHLYGLILGASADVVIAQRPQRFEQEPNGLISLRETGELDSEMPGDLPAAPPPRLPGRANPWQNSLTLKARLP